MHPQDSDPKMSCSLSSKLDTATLSECLDRKPLLPVVKLINTHIATASALLYIVVVGMVASYSSPATIDMRKPGSRFMEVTPDQVTWIASLPNISGVFGNILSGYLIHRFGRKAVMIFASTSFVSSWLIIAYSSTIGTIYFGRLISGFCAGLCCVAAPTYIVEIAPTEIRGRLTSGFQVAFASGAFLVTALGITLRWSWLAIAGGTVAASAALLMVFMPESPPWLVRNSRTAEAVAGLKFLKGTRSDFKKELQDITDNLSEEGTRVTWREFLDPALYKPTIISVLLMFFQQFSGINAMMSYTVEMFQNTGSSVSPNVAASIVAAVQIVGCIVGGVLMDKSGRKPLYITSGSCMTVALFILGLYSFVSAKHDVDLHLYGWIPLVSFVAYMFTYAFGVGTIPFVMTPELVPLHSRSTVVAIACFACSLFSFIVIKVFDNMKTTLGVYGLYWTYGFFSLLSAIFGCFILPETKGLTIHQINRQFSIPKNPV